MRELGMRPVLSAFAGFIPPAFVAKHPAANVTKVSPSLPPSLPPSLLTDGRYVCDLKVSEWGQYNGLNGTGFYGDYQQTLLEPTDPLFQAIGQAWIEEQVPLPSSSPPSPLLPRL